MKKITLLLILLFSVQISVFAATSLTSKTVGNTTNYYWGNKHVAYFKIMNLSNGFVEVEYCREIFLGMARSCNNELMMPMEAKSYQASFRKQVEEHSRLADENRRRTSPQEITKMQLKREQEQQIYMSEHARLVNEIDKYKQDLPNLDFELFNKYKSSYNTLIKDSYAVYTAPKNLLDLIPERCLFDGNLQKAKYSINDINYYLENSKKPIFIKYSIANNFNKLESLRFTYIHNNYYKDPLLSPAKGVASWSYEPEGRKGITLNDVKKWFEDYKKLLAPALDEYERVKREAERIEREESLQRRNELIQKSKEIQAKFPNSTIGNTIKDKQKKIIETNYSNLSFSSTLPLEQLYNLKFGHCYSLSGQELDLKIAANNDLKEENCLFVDKILIKKLTKLAKIKPIKTQQEYLLDEYMKNEYMQHVESNIGSHWNPSYRFTDKYTNRDVTVFFTLFKDGSVHDLKILKSSGNVYVDKEALDAVKNSAPFNSFPSGYMSPSMNVQFNFSYKHKL